MMGNVEGGSFNIGMVLSQLKDPTAYAHSVVGPVLLVETHISWIVLAGDFAYKIKKPLITEFLDYGTLEKRHHACCEELRLGTRYAEGLYIDVVPITFEDEQIRIDGDSQPLEFAVRMRRFPDESLLSKQLKSKSVTTDQMIQLASMIAHLHGRVAVHDDNAKARVAETLKQATDNFRVLHTEVSLDNNPLLGRIESWILQYFEEHRSSFEARVENGFVRECHGDLHCDNIVLWHDHWTPFDGIEFNPAYSQVDVLSDISFLVMDLRVRDRPDLAAVFLNSYLEQTGDYSTLSVLKWYLVHHALVRAKVGVIRSQQLLMGHHRADDSLSGEHLKIAEHYLQIANQLMQPDPLRLWITFGVSGSGKTTGSQRIVLNESAIRLRSDIERKRIFRTSSVGQQPVEITQGMYSASASQTTYNRLLRLAGGILQAGFAVIVDATFLRREDRQRFRNLAESMNIDFKILEFHGDTEILNQRITSRRLAGKDASDANSSVLANQLATLEPLTISELELTVPGNEL